VPLSLGGKIDATKAQRHKDFTKISFFRTEITICCKSACNKILICYVADNKNITMCAKLLVQIEKFEYICSLWHFIRPNYSLKP